MGIHNYCNDIYNYIPNTSRLPDYGFWACCCSSRSTSWFVRTNWRHLAGLPSVQTQMPEYVFVCARRLAGWTNSRHFPWYTFQECSRATSTQSSPYDRVAVLGWVHMAHDDTIK